MNEIIRIIEAQILHDREPELTLGQLCRACQVPAEFVLELVEQGVLEVQGGDSRQWRFPGSSLARVRAARRLQRDLQLNMAGTALALELLDEIQRLRRRLHCLENL